MSKAIQTKHYNSKINIWDKVEFNIIEQKSMREMPPQSSSMNENNKIKFANCHINS